MTAILFVVVQFSWSQTIIPESTNIQTNGNINTMQIDEANDIMYIGGNFTRIGNRARYGGAVDDVNGDLTYSHPEPNGTIKVAISDGAGGYFIAGDFTMIGETARDGLGHITSSGVVSSWDPKPNNEVLDMELSGGILYVGGGFTTIGGESRARIAAIDASTGSATSWDPGSNGNVSKLVVSGGFVYAYSSFANFIGGESIDRLAKISSSTGAAEATWNPSPNGTIKDMIIDGSNLYIGGSFTAVGGVTRNRLAALAISTGAATSWDPNVSAPVNGSVNAIAIHGGDLYAGGFFETVDGQTVDNLAEIDLTTGTASSFTLNGSSVSALSVSGNSLYIGNFNFGIAGVFRDGIGEVDLTTHTLTSWNPGIDVAPSTLAISGSDIYMGGTSSLLMGGERRNNLAAIELEDGIVTSWNPDADGTIKDIKISSTSVYVAGSFDNVGGQVRDNLAEIKKADGLATTFDPDVASEVNAILISGDQLFVGGAFTSVGGGSRNRLAVYDITDGSLSTWNPNLNSIVLSLASDGSTLYVGGNFTTAASTSRDRIAAYNIATESLKSWNPGANNRVESLITGNDGTVYAGGRFTTIGGLSRNRLAAIDPTTAVVSGLDINVSFTVNTIVPSSQEVVYVGGAFSSVDGSSQPGVFAFNSANGTVLSWDVQAETSVFDIALTDFNVYLGGTFSSVLGESTGDFAGVSRVNEAPVSFTLPDNAILENEAVNTAVGNFMVTDDSGDTHSYVLVAGDGDDDNASFGIDGISLIAKTSFDFETKNSYAIRARVTDDKGNFVEDSFTIDVSNVIETGTDITSISIPEQVSPADINTSTHTVNIDIGFGNDKSSLSPIFELSSGATADPISGTTRDFSLAKTYTITAENGFTDQDWLVFMRGYYPAQTFTVGPTGDFANLVAAFSDLTSVGISGDIVLELEDGFTDPGGTLTGGWTGQADNTVTIRPESGATSVSISSASNRCTVCIIDFENVIFDGMGIIEVENTNAFGVPFYFESGIDSETVEFKNISITSNSGDAFYIQDVDDVLIKDNSYSFGVNFNTQNSTVFRVLNTASDVKIFGNEIELDDQFDGAFSLIFVFSFIDDAYVYNNVVHAFPTSANSFTAFRDRGKFVHNTIVLDGPGTIGSSTMTRLSQSAIDAQITNNIIVADVNNDLENISSLNTLGPLQPSWDISSNNFFVRDADGVDYPDLIINGVFGSNDLSAVLAIAPGTSFTKPVFTDQANGNLTLAGVSLSDGDLRGTPNVNVLTDINETIRSTFASSKGAYETPNNVTDISSFTFTGIDGAAIIDKGSHTIDAVYLDGTDVTAISPMIEIITGASISPMSSTTQNFTSSVTYTVTAEAGNTQDWVVSVTDGTTSWNGTFWSNGTGPTAANNAEINGTFSTATNGNIVANDLTINSGASITVENGNHIEVNGDLVHNGTTFTVESGGALVTKGNVTGTNFTFERTTTFDESTGRYSIVGAPISGADFNTLGSNAIIYGYDETQPYNISGNEGLDRFRTPMQLTHSTMQVGTGYFSAKTGDVNGEITFAGTPNFGTQNVSLSLTDHPTDEDIFEGFNLVSNPYPCAIDYTSFISGNSNDIEGAIYLWDDFDSETARGTNADYVVINGMGDVDSRQSGLSKWDGYIRSMQGFFVQAKGTGDSQLDFTDAMKVTSNNDDAGYYRTTNEQISFKLTLESSEGDYAETLIGMREDASLATDQFDARLFSPATTTIYSLIGGEAYAIQGLPRTTNLEIPVGIKTGSEGAYKISMDESENLEGYNIMLVDHLLNASIEISLGETYRFSNSEQVSNNRFSVVISNEITNIGEVVKPEMIVFQNESKNLIIRSTNDEIINSVELISLTGQRKLLRATQINTNEWQSSQVIRSGLFLVRVLTENSESIQKIILK